LTDLRALAERYVTLEREIAEVRNAMRHALGNGVDAAPNPPPARSKPGGSRAEALAQAAEAEQRVLALLKDRPMKAAEIARQTASKVSTTAERMNRLERRGMVQRAIDGAWSLQSTPA
jgi:predicted Rossmann fold nucleotide-binding protein DprA/Smf involved in DNA uptake